MDPSLFDIRLDYGPRLIAVTAVVLAVSTITVTLRYYVRLCMLKTFGVDDWLLLIAHLFFIASGSQAFWDGVVAESDMPLFSKIKPLGIIIYSEPVLYFVTLVFLKMALAAFFLRIVVRRWQRVLIVMTVLIFSLFGAAISLMTLFKCGLPTWQKAIGGYTLADCTISYQVMANMTWAYTILNVISDWILAVAPIFAITHLQLNRAAKLSACALIGLGILGSVASIVRLPYIKVIEESTSSNAALIDAATNLVIVSMVECSLGIVALSLAALRPLMGRMLDVFRTTKVATYGEACEIVSSQARTPAYPVMGVSKTRAVLVEGYAIRAPPIEEEPEDTPSSSGSKELDRERPEMEIV